MKNKSDHFKRISLPGVRPTNGSPAFTLTELVVIIGVLALLAATLLPALANTKFRDQLAMCTANYRQWGAAWTAASSDTADGSFPMGVFFNGSGADIWNVSVLMISNVAPYGVTVPMWYCPVRPADLQRDNQWCIANLGHPVQTLADIYRADAGRGATRGVVNPNPATDYGNTYHNVWIQRLTDATRPTSIFPTTHNTVFPANPNSSANWQAGVAAGLPWPIDWLKKPSDPHAAQIPIMSDQVVGPQNKGPIFANTGHPEGGAVYNENLVYGDGHVESHRASTMVWRWDITYAAWY